MAVVDHRCRASVNHLHTAGQLAPESITRIQEPGGKIPSGHVLPQRLVGVSAFELRLPYVVMGVDEAGLRLISSNLRRLRRRLTLEK